MAANRTEETGQDKSLKVRSRGFSLWSRGRIPRRRNENVKVQAAPIFGCPQCHHKLKNGLARNWADLARNAGKGDRSCDSPPTLHPGRGKLMEGGPGAVEGQPRGGQVLQLLELAS